MSFNSRNTKAFRKAAKARNKLGYRSEEISSGYLKVKAFFKIV